MKDGWQQTLPVVSFFSQDLPTGWPGYQLALAGRGSINLYRGPGFLLECAVRGGGL
jgi:hypothetical protein